jgi:hypothetical protein
LLAHGRWFSAGTLASSTTKTRRHDIAEILLKVALSTINQSINQSTYVWLTVSNISLLFLSGLCSSIKTSSHDIAESGVKHQ